MPGHNRTNTSTAGEYKVGYMYFTFKILLRYPVSILVQERKSGNDMFNILFGIFGRLKKCRRKIGRIVIRELLLPLKASAGDQQANTYIKATS
jgi:hypothetical protein